MLDQYVSKLNYSVPPHSIKFCRNSFSSFEEERRRQTLWFYGMHFVSWTLKTAQLWIWTWSLFILI